MTRLLLWLGVGCVVLLAAGIDSSAPAAETELAGTTGEETTLTQADLEVTKAELRVRYAEEALADAQAQVDAGTAAGEVLRAARRELAEAQLALMETQLRAQEWKSQRVTLELTKATLEDALRLLFRRTPYSYILSPEIGRLALDPLTIRLKEVDRQTALRVICDTYDLLYRKQDSIYYFVPRSDVVTIGGRTVPLLGTLEVPHDVEVSLTSDPAEVRRSMIVRTTGGAASEARTRILLRKLAGFDELVDLEVEDATLAEVAEKLSVPRPDGAGWMTKIVVHPAVPEDIRVTAKVYGMGRAELVLMLAEQANLDVSVAPTPSEPDADVVHILPKPEINVYGTGVGRHWTQMLPGPRGHHDSSVMDRLRERAAKEGESFFAVPFPSCPKCEQLLMMPDWVFCPHCGTKLPRDKEPAAKGK